MPPTPTRPRSSSRPDGRRASRVGAPAPGRAKPTARENLRFWIRAIVVILILRAFIFEPFRIPSESMESTLLVGDFLIVSKLNYGARTPNTIGIPFTGIYIPGLELPQIRLPGFAEPKRGDVVVFNYPASQDVERGAIAEDVPVERRAPYIKRLVAEPGDTLAVLDKVLHINGRPVPLAETMKQRWRVTMTGPGGLPADVLADLGADLLGSGDPDSTGVLVADIAMTPGGARTLEARPDVASVVPSIAPEELRDPTFGANPDHVAPLVVPGRGVTLPLSRETWALYEPVIRRYEGHTASLAADGGFLIDGRSATSYTFAHDYFFAMGDSRDNSVDSRFWGFVPETHIVGRALFTFISVKAAPPFVRLSRFFRPIP
ncbi:MAG TPA: signal peptidase I [Rubricoccaceae bacterium]